MSSEYDITTFHKYFVKKIWQYSYECNTTKLFCGYYGIINLYHKYVGYCTINIVLIHPEIHFWQ